MAKPRIELQQIFETLLGTKNVYFQPPESVKLKYPCIVYERSGSRIYHANNDMYLKYKQYSVTYVDVNPDSEIPDEIEKMDHCRFERWFALDNLNQWKFTLYF